MKTTFLKDDYNNLWLFYAEDIKIRRKAPKEKIYSSKFDYFRPNNNDSYNDKRIINK